MSSFLDIIINEQTLSDKDRRAMESHIKVTTVSKGESLQRPGDLQTKGYFVKSGLLRSYTIDEKGKEHIFMFAPEDWIVSDIESQTKQSPAVLHIDALEDSEIEMVDKDLMDLQFDDFPNVSVRGEVHKLLRRIAVLQNRVIMLMSATARERYEEFIKTYPGIVQRVPQKMIASYLGITPEALSKIRGEIVKEK